MSSIVSHCLLALCVMTMSWNNAFVGISEQEPNYVAVFWEINVLDVVFVFQERLLGVVRGIIKVAGKIGRRNSHFNSLLVCK